MSSSERPIPDIYDGTQFLIHIDLPEGKTFKLVDLHEHVYGIRFNTGVKPLPYYQDAADGKWWSLSHPGDKELTAAVWMIDIEQLQYMEREEAEDYMEAVIGELSEAATKFGGTAVPEGNAQEAMEKMDQVLDLLRVRDFEVLIRLAAPEGYGYPVEDIMMALESEGLVLGDGELFWMMNEDRKGDEPDELFCVEPYSIPGYFHPGDMGQGVVLPDVAFRFQPKKFEDPMVILKKMGPIAESVAEKLEGNLFRQDGRPYDLEKMEWELEDVMEEMETLREKGVVIR